MRISKAKMGFDGEMRLPLSISYNLAFTDLVAIWFEAHAWEDDESIIELTRAVNLVDFIVAVKLEIKSHGITHVPSRQRDEKIVKKCSSILINKFGDALGF